MQTETNTTELTEEEVAELVADAPAPNNGADNNGGTSFCPTDAAGVDWVLGKMSAARAEATLIRQNAEAMARECERRAEHLEWKYGAALQTWLRAEIAGGTKKSKRLFHGVLGYRQKPAGVTVTDPAAALSWARSNVPGAVTEALDKKALAEALLTNGESVPFAEYQAAEEVFYIK